MSTLKVGALQGISASSDAITLANDGTCTANITNRPNRNVVINGSFSIWQRGTSINSQGNGQNDYTADRFAIGHNNSHMAAVTQQDGTGTNAGFRYCARIQRDSGNSQTDQIRFHTAFETNNVIPLRGKKLTLSFYARKGANYSEANSKITNVLVATGENTDGNPNSYAGGGFTNASNIINGTDATLTTDWQRFTYTSSTVSNTTNSIIIEFRFTPVGTAGANDDYEITGVQLEVGSVATDFEHRSFGQELELCSRYHQEIYVGGQATMEGINDAMTINGSLRTAMRASPTGSAKSVTTNTNVNSSYPPSLFLSEPSGVAIRGIAAGGGLLHYQALWAFSSEL